MRLRQVYGSRVALAGVAFCALLATLAGAAQAVTHSGPIHTIELKEDRFLNYDFHSEKAERTNADWPVNLIFYGNASINKVKSKLGWALPYWTGSAQHAKVNNGTGWVWDSDKGRKSLVCTLGGQTDVHMRLYAPPSTDTLWNRTWGYYVIGTSHYDHNECWRWGTWFGYSEDAEHWIASYSRVAWGSSRVNEDYLDLSNPRYAVNSHGQRVPFQEDDHVWWSNGRATVVRVP